MPPEIQAVIEGVSLLQVLIWGAAIAAVLVGAYKAWPVLKRFVATVDALADLPEHMAKTTEQLNELSSTVAVVKHEVMPNTGTSLRDAADRTEAAVTVLQTAMDDVHSKLDNDNKRITDLSGRVEEHITQSTVIIDKLTKEKP